ncbi:hypothetical protein OAS37_07695 [Alphaproteobacteria bacterium]|nr:hypothetical protein [Alphaproteobacteria bacterium]
MKTLITFNRIETKTIGLVQSNLNKLSDTETYKLRQKRLRNLTQSELQLFNRFNNLRKVG